MRAKPISINVDGRGAELYSHLLNLQSRPVPKAPTHFVVFDVIHKDLSIKRVMVYFNPDNTWDSSQLTICEDDKVKYAGKIIGESSSFLDDDPNVVAYKYVVLEVGTCKLIYTSPIYNYLDYDKQY